MAEKRKISIRKILQMLTTIVVSTGCVIAMASASSIEDSKTVKSIAVHIRNDKKYHFIEEKEILDLVINNRSVDVAHTPMSRLDIKGMERVLRADPWVANAQVYVDNDNVLEMYITQRIPVARLFQQNGLSYYMDTTLSLMPLSRSYIYYTTVVTNVPEMKNDSASWALRKDVRSLVQTIQSDSFWSAQVAQIIIDSDNTFELVPMLGDQRIIFGDATRMKDKLSNLFTFYKNVLNRIGWDKYETLDLRFNDQVVASPSLPYKGPVDKAVVNMNWINSIVETEARNDSMHEENKKIAEEKKQEAASARPVKPVMNAVPKKDVKKPVDKKKTKDIKKAVKPGDKHKDDKTKEKRPKYVYPEKKVH